MIEFVCQVQDMCENFYKAARIKSYDLYTRTYVIQWTQSQTVCIDDKTRYLVSQGIHRHLTVPFTPQHNGVAELAYRKLNEMARSMLVHHGVGENFLGETLMTAAYLRNRSDKTPLEVCFGKKSSVSQCKGIWMQG